jgi:hypothetical protein
MVGNRSANLRRYGETWRKEMGHTAAVPMIATLAAHSVVAKYPWKNRGIAPPGYIKGMAVAFGRAYCKWKLGHPAAIEMAKPDSQNPLRDALTHYKHEFTMYGMDNSHGGADVLRHLYVLMVGLGMRESSGHYGEGRDASATNTSSATAEAGLFQVSYNSHTASLLLDRLLVEYHGSNDFLDIFKEGVTASAASLQNWGTGTGQEFQRLTKACPAFAAEYAGVALRHLRTHWGPIIRKAAEVRPECDDLFQSVQRLIDNDGFTSV